MNLKQTTQKALITRNVPPQLASQCAEVIASDDPSKPKNGRTPNQQYLIDASSIWMKQA